ncbi:hypothetical protein [Desulfobacula sp.]|uniref:hypothetical protein n=1 Tax=Desulfobacula sp. TaxID=2593537 RepID=UPI0039B8BDE8
MLLIKLIKKLFSINVEIGKQINQVKENSILFFPIQPNTVSCGISAFIAFKGSNPCQSINLMPIENMVISLKAKGLLDTKKPVQDNFFESHDLLCELFEACRELKQEAVFSDLFFNKSKIKTLLSISQTIEQLILDQTAAFNKKFAFLSSSDIDAISSDLENLQDISWCLKKEILKNIHDIGNLSMGLERSHNNEGLKIFKRINAVLNSIDRLEVRGRDSAGISIMFTLTKKEFEKFLESLSIDGLSERFKKRTNHLVLSNNSITIKDSFAENRQPLCNYFICL